MVFGIMHMIVFRIWHLPNQNPESTIWWYETMIMISSTDKYFDLRFKMCSILLISIFWYRMCKIKNSLKKFVIHVHSRLDHSCINLAKHPSFFNYLSTWQHQDSKLFTLAHLLLRLHSRVRGRLVSPSVCLWARLTRRWAEEWLPPQWPSWLVTFSVSSWWRRWRRKCWKCSWPPLPVCWGCNRAAHR